MGLEGRIEYETAKAKNDGKITDPRYLMVGGNRPGIDVNHGDHRIPVSNATIHAVPGYVYQTGGFFGKCG